MMIDWSGLHRNGHVLAPGVVWSGIAVLVVVVLTDMQVCAELTVEPLVQAAIAVGPLVAGAAITLEPVVQGAVNTEPLVQGAISIGGCA